MTHSHPGRVVWLVFNIAIALMLMEMGVFHALEKILGLYSNIAIAWIGAVVADLVINKPLKLSPPMVEFKRAHLFNFNPVGFVSMVAASLLSIAAFTGLFGLYAQAYSSLIALSVSFILAPIIAKITQGKYYIARPNEHYAHSNELERCDICEQHYAQADFAYCTFYEAPICSLCCTLDSVCHDHCKPKKAPFYRQLIIQLLAALFQDRLSKNTRKRIANFSLVWGVMLTLTGITLWLSLSIQTESLDKSIVNLMASGFYLLFFVFALFSSIAAWWIILLHESTELAKTELNEQNQILSSEVTERRLAEAQATQLAHKLQQQSSTLQKNYIELTLTHNKLAQSEELFRELIQVQSAIFWRLDVESFQFTFVSEQAEALLGYSNEQWLSPGFWQEHLHDIDKSWVLDYCKNETQALRNHEFEYRMITASGKTLWLRNVVHVVVNNGKVAELMGFMIDVTQSKMDRERIQYLSDLYATLSQINHAIVHISDETELFKELCRITVKFGD
ncbi:MAG: PAS domain S-box protein, partial [Methyloprofundus sp.]|nr:PAS domain S-box protein [Methyloprofundus sp.]